MASSNKKQRFAGSAEFTNGLTLAKDPFSKAANRSQQEANYSAYEKRGYDDLSNLETYRAKAQNSRIKEGGKFDAQDQARSSMKSSDFKFDGDLSGYDSKAAGRADFNMQDVKYLKEGGASDEQIKKHIAGLDQVGESIKNNSIYGGSHYRGDMDKSQGIEQYDMGKGFNKADIKYLQGQGYDDEAIADYGLSTGKGHGQYTAKWLDKQGRLDTRAKNTFADRESKNPFTAPADISEQQDRVDQEMNKDYWGRQVNRENKWIANSPNEHDSKKFYAKHLGMARAAADTRTGLDLSQYKSGFKLDINALAKQIDRTPLYWGARSELQGLKTFGDTYRNARENPKSWAQPTPMEGVKAPDFTAWYDKYTKDIDDIKV